MNLSIRANKVILVFVFFSVTTPCLARILFLRRLPRLIRRSMPLRSHPSRRFARSSITMTRRGSVFPYTVGEKQDRRAQGHRFSPDREIQLRGQERLFYSYALLTLSGNRNRRATSKRPPSSSMNRYGFPRISPGFISIRRPSSGGTNRGAYMISSISPLPASGFRPKI